MSIFKLAWELFILYLVYKLVFELIIPVAKTTKKVKQQFGDMAAQMQAQQREQQKAAAQHRTTTNTTPPPKASSEDYIEFEEIK